jgi:hypothetical protein
MVTGCLIQWRLEALLKKKKGLVCVFVKKDPRESESIFWSY